MAKRMMLSISDDLWKTYENTKLEFSGNEMTPRFIDDFIFKAGIEALRKFAEKDRTDKEKADTSFSKHKS